MDINEHLVHLENGRLAPDTGPEHVQRLVRRALESDLPNGLVIHFHGGLVSHNSGLEIAQRLARRYDDAGAYPVFLLWESGFPETLINNFREIIQDLWFRLLWKRVCCIAARKFEQKSQDRDAGTLPEVETSALEASIDQALDRDDLPALDGTEIPIPPNLEDLNTQEEISLELEMLRDKPLVEQIEREPMRPRERSLLPVAAGIKAVVSLARRVIRRFRTGRDHGFHATVVEEILREFYLDNVGELVWRTMKKDTGDSFQDDSLVFGGTALLEALRAQIDPLAPPRITLIGHSAGALYIAEFLDNAAGVFGPHMGYDIVFLAPATTFQRAGEMLERHRDRIRSLRIFGMTDSYERRDRLVGILYPQSLLYFVSGVVENGFDVPLAGMARYYDRDVYPDEEFPELGVFRDFIKARSDRSVWSVTESAPEGLRSHSEHHGDFDNDETTLLSLEYMIRQQPPE